MNTGLGAAPEHLKAAEKSVWEEIASQVPQALACDRPAFELLVGLEALRRAGTIDSEQLQALAEMRAKFFLQPIAEA